MKKNSLKNRDIQFAKIGEYETIKKEKKIGAEKIKEEPLESLIYFDGRQYSCKIPKKVMDTVGFRKGDKLKFTLIKIPREGVIELEVEYVKSR
ncbi:MAG: hypothetical protein PHE43_01490 [Candidatus Nanoarchaeia archaeon]|nr:hypothetical protein [Candidatus Nanoarchaeia archaeon]